VIHNGAEAARFQLKRLRTPWNGRRPAASLVTHHWGAHELKGFDVVSQARRAAGDPAGVARARRALTYIGNAPTSAKLAKHVRFMAPLNGDALASAISAAHHGYMTGSHQRARRHASCRRRDVRPAAAVYRRSGALPEYCSDYGIGFDGPQDIESALEHFLSQYRELVARMPAYPYDAARTTSRWLELLGDLVGRRDDIAARRRPWRDPGAFLLNQLPL
jgi:hypothetical protein